MNGGGGARAHPTTNKPHRSRSAWPALSGCPIGAGRGAAGVRRHARRGAGYARGLLEAGAGLVIGIDREPGRAFDGGRLGRGLTAERIFARSRGKFRGPRTCWRAKPVDGVTLDLGVSSMQLDDQGAGLSPSMGEGPLDMAAMGAVRGPGTRPTS